MNLEMLVVEASVGEIQWNLGTWPFRKLALLQATLFRFQILTPLTFSS